MPKKWIKPDLSKVEWQKCKVSDCDRQIPVPMVFCSSECYRKYHNLPTRLEQFREKKLEKKSDSFGI